MTYGFIARLSQGNQDKNHQRKDPSNLHVDDEVANGMVAPVPSFIHCQHVHVLHYVVQAVATWGGGVEGSYVF